MTPRKPKQQPVAGQPTLVVESRAIDGLLADPANARMHSTRNIDAIAASLRRFGQQKPLVLDRKGIVVAGNGTLEAMKQEGWEWCDVVVFPGTAAEARAYAIADNRTAELAHWDHDVLLDTLKTLPGTLLAATGYSEDDMATLLEGVNSNGLEGSGEPGDDDDNAVPGKGELLAIAAATVGEPDYDTARGQIWTFDHHVLIVADVHEDWELWAEYLSGDILFWPYPSLLAPFTEVAEKRPVLMVQPNLYLAGWLLTKWARITGKTPTLEQD